MIEDEEIIYEDEELTDEDESPDSYIVVIEAVRNMKQANLYELEYTFKSVLSEDERLKKVVLSQKKKALIYYFGRPYKVYLFEKKLQTNHFKVVDIFNDFQNE